MPKHRTYQTTEDDYITDSENNAGVCLACLALASGVEPDARRYRCDNCDQQMVYGLEQALIMGCVEFIADED
jgi:hypothetical protein